MAQPHGALDRVADMLRIWIDEKSHRRGHKHLIIMADQATGRVVWVREGRSKKAVSDFNADLGERCAKVLRRVSCDGARWTQ